MLSGRGGTPSLSSLTSYNCRAKALASDSRATKSTELGPMGVVGRSKKDDIRTANDLT